MLIFGAFQYSRLMLVVQQLLVADQATTNYSVNCVFNRWSAVHSISMLCVSPDWFLYLCKLLVFQNSGSLSDERRNMLLLFLRLLLSNSLNSSQTIFVFYQMHKVPCCSHRHLLFRGGIWYEITMLRAKSVILSARHISLGFTFQRI